MKKKLGGERLGSGKKIDVDLQDFGYSEHDLTTTFRSTMSAGTLVPYLVLPALPGDEWDITLNADVRTLPTVAPVFGSFKVQLDLFTIPIRLYNSWAHNNKLGIGNDMSQVKQPILQVPAYNEVNTWYEANPADYPINNAHILKYLGISGAGRYIDGTATNKVKWRNFNAIPLLGYWDIFKNYYANKQETSAYVLGTEPVAPYINAVSFSTTGPTGTYSDITTTNLVATNNLQTGFKIVSGVGTNYSNILQLLGSCFLEVSGTAQCNILQYYYGQATYLGNYTTTFPAFTASINSWYYWTTNGILFTYGYSKQNYTFRNFISQYCQNYSLQPNLYQFDLTEIDDIREAILGTAGNTAVNVNNLDGDLIFYTLPITTAGSGWEEYSTLQMRYSQQGLLVKTYQSDIFNNWLNETTIGSIGVKTRVDTSAGYLTIDSLELSYKVYRMLNQIAVSGGTMDDWQDAVYAHERFKSPEIPQYLGGLSKELIFTELFSTAQGVSLNNQVQQPLGTIGAKGTMGTKHKGGYVHHTTSEISYLMGIVSITPRIDYSQGNEWWTSLQTWDDYHKPHLDAIGFQDLLTEQMYYVGTHSSGGAWQTTAVGKQPAWLNYMTNINRDYGLFAEKNNLMCMVINRRYTEADRVNFEYEPIWDLTTYVEPQLYNYIFAYAALDSQNYWTQILANIKVRRKMSAKVMPNI